MRELMMRTCVVLMALLLSGLVLPSGAFAQASITGTVRDASGAVLPGVTVEATSPVLIEKVRAVVTDDSGHYRIENLRPGAYVVTFALAGFLTVQRQGVELAGSFTATINVELRVGALEETIIVTGESPVVDVQNVTQQRVVDPEAIAALPTGRSDRALGALIPGVVGGQDGGIPGVQGGLTVHGSGAGTIMQSGVAITQGFGTNGSNNSLPNMVSLQEVSYDISAGSAEMTVGGVRINFTPKDGGNTFNGTLFGAFANHSMQGNNYSKALQDAGLRAPSTLDQMWEVNPGFGGPIKRDTLWFYASYRHYTNALSPPGAVFNLNANKPAVWTYAPDTSGRQPTNDATFKDFTARVTWQATPRNKIALTWTEQPTCFCLETIAATVAPEASVRRYYLVRNVILDWMSPVTNRVLLEAAAIPYRYQHVTRDISEFTSPDMVSVVDQGLGNMVYRAPQGTNNLPSPFRNTDYLTSSYRAAASYITGAHAFKVGGTLATLADPTTSFPATQPYNFRFNNGVPNQITLFATPSDVEFNADADVGLYAQDKWTVGRLALSYGLRYDYFKTSYPAQTLGPGPLVPTRNIELPTSPGVSWHDLSYRTGAVYDLFGDGRTAVRVTLNKYLSGQGDGGPFGLALAPANLIVQTTTRNWTDANRNYVPECDLTLPGANGECGAMANPNFGRPVPGSRYDPDTLSGWGKRGFDWEFSTGVQREILPRTSLSVGYFRRWFGNAVITDDRAVTASDYSTFGITAPNTDPRLSTAGSTITGLYNLKPEAFGRPSDNYVTFAKNYGAQIQHWNGFDVTMTARPTTGVQLQGGMSTGRTSTDNCEVAVKVPAVLQVGTLWSPLQFCHQDGKFLTQVKWSGSYTIPRVNVLFSAVLQSLPGPAVLANYVASNTVVAPSLGRSLSGNAQNLTVGLLSPGSESGKQSNVMDIRVGKILRVGTYRAALNLDFYNLLNNNTPTVLNNTFGGATPWLGPQTIPLARFAKISAQLDF